MRLCMFCADSVCACARTQAKHDTVVAAIDFGWRAAALRATPPELRSLKCARLSLPRCSFDSYAHERPMPARSCSAECGITERRSQCRCIRGSCSELLGVSHPVRGLHRSTQTVLSLGGVDVRGLSEKREFVSAAEALFASLPPLACEAKARRHRLGWSIPRQCNRSCSFARKLCAVPREGGIRKGRNIERDRSEF